MGTRRVTMVLLGVFVLSACIFGFVTQAETETLKFKAYTYAVKAERAPVGDVDGHTVGFSIRKAFIVFENGEVATQTSVGTSDAIKGSGSSVQYQTLVFSDGSTIIIKTENIVAGTAPGAPTSAKLTREIIKGTGRFAGIKGSGTSTVKYFPLEEGEVGPKGVGEGSITYTLPSKCSFRLGVRADKPGLINA